MRRVTTKNGGKVGITRYLGIVLLPVVFAQHARADVFAPPSPEVQQTAKQVVDTFLKSIEGDPDFLKISGSSAVVSRMLVIPGLQEIIIGSTAGFVAGASTRLVVDHFRNRPHHLPKGWQLQLDPHLSALAFSECRSGKQTCYGLQPFEILTPPIQRTPELGFVHIQNPHDKDGPTFEDALREWQNPRLRNRAGSSPVSKAAITSSSAANNPPPMITNANQREFDLQDFDEDDYFMLQKAIVALTGHEMPIRNYRRALGLLNSKTKMGLDPLDLEALGLIFNALAVNTPRFDGSAFFEPGVGENSATHSIHVSLIITEWYRRAGLLSPNVYTADIAERRLRTARAGLIHDVGEILEEPMSLSQAIAASKPKDDPILEGAITRFALSLAYHFAETLSTLSFQERFERFQHVLGRMKRDLDVRGRGTGTGESVDQIIARNATFTMPPEITTRLDHWMNVYYMMEASQETPPPPPQDFDGLVGKNADRYQGKIHFVRFATKPAWLKEFNVDGETIPVVSSINGTVPHSLPWDLAESAEILGETSYINKFFGPILKAGRTPTDRRLASVIQSAIYQSSIDQLTFSPEYIDRKNHGVDKELREQIDRMIAGELSADEYRELQNRLSSKQVELAAQYSKEYSIYRLARSTHGEDGSAAQALDVVFRVERRDRLGAWLRYLRDRGYQPAPGINLVGDLEQIAKEVGPLPHQYLE